MIHIEEDEDRAHDRRHWRNLHHFNIYCRIAVLQSIVQQDREIALLKEKGKP